MTVFETTRPEDYLAGGNVIFALAWSAAIAVVGYGWGRHSFRARTA